MSLAEFLRVETLDSAFADAIRRDWRTAPGLLPREQAILAYIEKVTKTPSRIVPEDLEALRAQGLDDRGILQALMIVPEDLEPLRAEGLDDRGILQALMICAKFNSLKRIADGIGVGKGTLETPLLPDGV